MEAGQVESCLDQNSCLSKVIVIGSMFLIVSAFPLTQITLGVQHLHECPISPGIPVYVICWGVTSMLLIGMFALPKLFCPSATDHVIWRVGLCSLILFFFIWFIYGSYLIYSIYPPNYNKTILHQNKTNTRILTPDAPQNTPIISFVNQNQSENHNQSKTLNQSQNQNQNQNLNQNQNQNQNQYPNQSNNHNQIMNQNLNHSKEHNTHRILNQTGMIQDTNNTVMNLTQTLSLRDRSEMNTEHLNAPQAASVEFVVPYCNKSLYLFAFTTNTMVYLTALLCLNPDSRVIT